MRVIDSCAKCLFDRQVAKANRNIDKNNENIDLFINKVKQVLDNRGEMDSAPYLVSVFNEIYAECFGKAEGFSEIKKEYNDFVMNMENDIMDKIIGNEDDVKECLKRAILYARVGNYIDFGAMNNVSKEKFLSLFDDAVFSKKDEETFSQFYEECKVARNFLIITDNCGEIVIDKLFIKVLKKCFPNLSVKALVRGKEVLNDATYEDATYIGLLDECKVIQNGTAIAGTIYEMINDEAKSVLNEADVILAKGQGNYESMAGLGRHVYYSFLCKCDLFTSKFNVPRLTGIFLVE